MTGWVELRLPPAIPYVGLARLVVVSAARQAGMDPERLEDLRLVVSEAVTNSMLAHEAVASDEAVCVAFAADVDSNAGKGDFEVLVGDCGPGFEAAGGPPDGTRDWSSEGGLGLTLIRGLADDVEFQREDGMEVRLRFHIGAAAEAEG